MANTRITEKIEYLTDIITAYDGHEQRLKLRQKPRYSYSYDYDAMDKYQAQWLRGQTRMRQSDLWYIPMWHSPAYLSEDFIEHGKALYIDDKYMYNFRDCEYIEIFFEDDFKQQSNIVRTVHSYQPGVIRLKGKIDVPLYTENTFIYPLRQCSTTAQDGLKYIYSNGTAETLNFEVVSKESKITIPYNSIYNYQTDADYFNDFGLPEQFLGKEVFLEHPQWVGDDSQNLTVSKNIQRMDNNTGTFVFDLRTTNSYDIHTTTILLDSQSRINNIKRFFERVCGRYKSFYMPTWVNDFQVDRDLQAQDNFMYTNFNILYKYYISNGRPKNIVIFTKNFQSYIREIASYSYEKIGDDTYGKLILSDKLGISIPKEEILMVCYLNLVRLDSDELVINYESNVVANTTLVTREVDDLL